MQVGQTVSVDFIEARAGAIVVTGRRSAQPVQAQTVATNITPAQIENLPQNSRNFLSFAQLAPGVQLISPSGAQQLQAGALEGRVVVGVLDQQPGRLGAVVADQAAAGPAVLTDDRAHAGGVAGIHRPQVV